VTSERPPGSDEQSPDAAAAGRDQRQPGADLAHQLDALRLRQQELERQNEALRLSAERYRSYTDHLADAVFVHDFAGRFVEVNRQACASLGYTRDELLGMGVFDVELDVDFATAQAAWSRITIDQRFTLVGRQRRKDGSVFPVEIALTCFEVTGQRLFQGVARDITERTAQEQRLAASEQHYRALFEVAPIPFVLNDASQRIVRLNAAFLKTFGYSLADIPTLADWWPRAYPDPDYRQWVAKTWQQHLDTAARNGTTFEPIELTIRCKDGSQIVALVGAEALAGSADGLHLVMLHNISERKKADTALHALAETQTAILNALPAHIALLDPQGVIVAVNDSWRRFGSANALQSTDFFVGRNYLQVCESAAGDCSQEARQVADGLRAVLNGTRSEFSIEYPCHSPNEKRWFRLMATRLHQERLAGVVIMHVNVTDRRLAEEVLRRNTLLLEDSQSTARVGGWELDLATKDLFWTAETYRIHDTSTAEFNPTVETAVGYFLPESRRIISLALQTAMERGDGYDLVLESLTAKGRRIDVRTTCTVTLHEGRPAKLTGIFQDITDQTAAEAALRDSETRWRFAVEGAGDGLWDWRVSDSTVFFSPRWKQILGHAEDEIGNGLSEWSSRVHPDDLPGVMADLQPHLDGHTPSYVNEHRVRCKDGSYKWILDRGLVMSRDAAGRPQRMVGTHKDITERKLAESAARDSESRFRALFDSATESIITMDEAGVVLSVNRSAVTTFGYTAQDLIGTRLEAILPTPHREQHPSYLRRYLDTGEKRIIGIGRVVEGLRKDGSRITMHLSISEARTGQQRIFMGLLRDLTVELQAAETKKQLEAQLFQAMKMESLGVLAGGIAHDFNNILVSILGYTNLAMQWNATDVRTVKALDQVMAAGNRASNLVKQILTFSRRGVQTQALCDLGHLVDEVGGLMQVGRPNNIAYHVSGSQQKHLVMGDPSQIHQVLTNLCVNAIQSMPNGGRLAVLLDTITFAPGQPRPDAVLLDEQYCRIRVQDSGTGIPAHIQARIFEPFFSTKGAKGTGLGLSVVHGIIARHRGAITVDSQAGTGTVFTVYLPTVGADTRMPSETQPARPTTVGRIMLIAETASLRAPTQDMLTQMGYTVDAYAQPALALAALADPTLRYDLVLGELAMTELDDIQVCKELRALQRTTPIGLIAPNQAVSDWASLTAAGATFILTAPFTYFELAREIAQSVIPGMTSSKDSL